MKKQNPYEMHQVQVIDAIRKGVKPNCEEEIEVIHGVPHRLNADAFTLLNGMVFALNVDYQIFQALKAASNGTIGLNDYMFYLSDEGIVYLWYDCN